MARHDYWPRYGLENYSFVLPLEDSFNGATSTAWMQENWLHSLSASAAYLVVIFGGQKFMESRKPFALDTPLFLWNAALAIFSILGFLRMTPEWFWSWTGENDLKYSICVASFAQAVSGFWTEQFALSKVRYIHRSIDRTEIRASVSKRLIALTMRIISIAELLDTVFIVARKRPLLFLHWYHHISVLVYTWHAYKDHTASGRWFIWMNYGVHAVMYSYYAIRSLKWRTPKWIAMLITVLQISQMIAGVTIGIAVYRIKSAGGECQQTWENLGLNLSMYFSYFLLFCNFFYHAYLKKTVADKKDKSSKTEETKELKEEAPKQERNGVTTRRRAQKVD
ncbi:hypothetical protein PFISCL1PPCAC_16213 [Pristionchus fissidentatus]|uniref:Elongation of very long chain fatty acids protein n=1 Tax=Pristionchus fissidentatus TaxID=1538716 RepID=A0AAV5VYK4_9BILA|nr:hypothetical protein PFISCL1PPCAC_16213 [Pristionchus fissidentatus]